VRHELAPGRHGWLQVVRGSLTANGLALAAGDGVAISEESVLEVTAGAVSEALLFDLA
jgi:redox-sensitive bicupin YhaK (pirin superfamily)